MRRENRGSCFKSLWLLRSSFFFLFFNVGSRQQGWESSWGEEDVWWETCQTYVFTSVVVQPTTKNESFRFILSAPLPLSGLFSLCRCVYVPLTSHFARTNQRTSKKNLQFSNGPREQGSSKKAKSPVGAMTLLYVRLFFFCFCLCSCKGARIFSCCC